MPPKWMIEYKLEQKVHNDPFVCIDVAWDGRPLPHRGDSFTIKGNHYECYIFHIDHDSLIVRIFGKQM